MLPRVERILELFERRFAGADPDSCNADALAYRWRDRRLLPIADPDEFSLETLIGVERSVERLRANARAFTQGRPALDVLLYGDRGTGKSSAVRGLLREYGPQGFRLIEIRRDALAELPEVFSHVRRHSQYFGLLLDDLSFEANDAAYKELKAALDGGLEARPSNLIILATSNRRHMISESLADNREATIDEHNDLHPGETAEEKLSLSDRFGLLLPFLGFNQETFLKIVDHYADTLGLAGEANRADIHSHALRFALTRAGRSGRTAQQACIEMLQTL